MLEPQQRRVPRLRNLFALLVAVITPRRKTSFVGWLQNLLRVMVGVLFLALVLTVFYGMVFGVAPTSHLATTNRPASPGWLVVRYGWCLLLTASFCYPLAKGKLQPHWRHFKAIRPLMVVQNLGVIAVVVAVAAGLYWAFPFLDRSWLYLFPVNDGQAANINILPAQIKYFGIVFVGLLILNLPLMAYEEEMKFRRGTKDWKHGFRRSLRFGLVHCWVGIPIFVGLALAVGGLWFTHQYFKGGVERSTAHHLTYNMIIAAFLICYLFAEHLVY